MKRPKRERYAQLMNYCRRENVSPGGSADLLSVTLFLYFVDRSFSIPSRHSKHGLGVMAIFQEKTLNLRNPYALKQLDAFLTPLGFSFDPRAVDYTMILCDAQGAIAGTGSYQGQVLKYVVVAPAHRATNAFSVIVTHLIRLLMKRHKQIFAFTRPGNTKSFERQGFKEVATAEPLYTLMEFGYRSIQDYRDIPAITESNPGHPPISAIVVNCNPFHEWAQVFDRNRRCAKHDCLSFRR